MELIAIVSGLALLEYVFIMFRVGQARGRYDVKAPAVTGDPIFERHFRVQQNTIEQLVIFLPALWLFGSYVSALFGALLGVVFIVGRGLYLRSYVADPESRGTGFVLSFGANVLLLLGGLIGALLAWL